jgi:hypothetical protein
MSSEFISALERQAGWSVAEVLETMFFATAVPGEGECGPDSLKVRIDFRGAPSGVFAMALDRGDARALASAFLGCEPEQMSSEHDGLLACELANIVCGSMLSRAGAECAFDLGAPRLVSEDFSGAQVRAGFQLDTGGGLEIGFQITGEEAA